MSSYIRKIGEAAAAVRKSASVIDDSYKQAGIQFRQEQSLQLRLQFLTKVHEVTDDERQDINDRVKYVNTMVTLVDMAWGRGGSNPSWSELYNAWQDCMSWWYVYESQRRAYKPAYMAEVSEKVQIPVMATGATSSTSTEFEDKWSEPTFISPETYLARFLIDRDKKQETIKLLDLAKVPSVINPLWATDTAFIQEFAEESVRHFGQVEMIPRGFKMLNYGFHELDVTTQNVMVFHMNALQNPDRNRPPDRESSLDLGDAAKKAAEARKQFAK